MDETPQPKRRGPRQSPASARQGIAYDELAHQLSDVIAALQAEKEMYSQQIQRLQELNARQTSEVEDSSTENDRGNIKQWGVSNASLLSGMRIGRQITRHFWGISLDELALEQLAELVNREANNDNRDISIEITSSDESDKFLDQKPSIFRNPELPRHIGKVLIDYRSYAQSAVQCTILLDFVDKPRVEYAVYGNDTRRVSGLAHDLERILKDSRSAWWWLSQSLYPTSYKPSLYGLILGFVTGFLVFLLAFIGLDALLSGILGRSAVSSHDSLSVPLQIAGIAAAIAGVIGGLLFVDVVRSLVPPVRLVGRFADRRAGRRSVVIWTIGFIAVPLVVTVSGNLLTMH